ncbi:MAG: tRNA pseudouridine(13) synthase TruD, partial [Planctomycetaceae bacterium]
MSQTEIQLAENACAATRLSGLPNYFDDQRFGSLGASGEWIARAWCLGDWERALWLALADHHPDDPSAERSEKQILRDNWGRWPECQQALAKSHRRSIVTYLSDKIKAGKPADFRGALARINIDLRGLYLSAWQSELWNRLLSRYLQTILPAD